MSKKSKQDVYCSNGAMRFANTLKNLLVRSRHRLEGNSDHWQSLHLSLRELAEWTVTKEAELEAMGPVGGDELAIRKQQVKGGGQGKKGNAASSGP